MRPFNSIFSSFKTLSKVLIVLTAMATLASCQKSSERNSEAPPDATGRGNGGNTITLSKAQVDELFKDLKPKIEILFEGLSYLIKAEKKAAGSTEIGVSNEALLSSLEALFLKPENETDAMEDLATEDNLVLQEDPCVDFRGVPNIAAAVAGEVGGKICFSSNKIRTASIKNLENAAEIFLLALAAHEFTHHFVNSGNPEADEAAARAVQDFVEQQLAKRLEDEESEIISTAGDKYLQRFRDQAKQVYDAVGGLSETP